MGGGRGGTAASGDEDQRMARNHADTSEQGNTSGRATTPAKQQHGVARRTRTGGRPVLPGQDKGVPHHTRSGGRPVRPGQDNTTDQQHPTTPAVQRQRQQHTKKTGRASIRLQHHEAKPEHADTACPTMGGATHKHGTPQQGGGARTSTAPAPARQTQQTTNIRQRRPYGGGDNSKPTKQAEHPAGYNTTNRNPNSPTQHAPPRGGPRTNTARPNRGGGGTDQHSTSPGQTNTTDNQHPTTPAVWRRRQQQTNKTSRASSRLQHHEPKPEHTDTAHPTRGGGARTNTARPNRGGGGTHQHSTNPGQANNTNATTTHPTDDDNPNQTPPPRQAGTNTARPSERGATHQHSTPHHEGGHKPTQHAPPRGFPAQAQHQPRSGQHHRQPTPDNAGRTAAETTANQQNKPSIQPATTPRTETGSRRHSMPHQGGGHAQTRHAPPGEGHAPAHQQTRPSQQHNRNHNPPNRRRQPKPNTTKPHTTTAADRHQNSTPHREGSHAPTQHTPP